MKAVQTRDVVKSLKYRFRNDDNVLVAEAVDGINLDEMKEFFQEVEGKTRDYNDGFGEVEFKPDDKEKEYVSWLNEKITTKRGEGGDETPKAEKFAAAGVSISDPEKKFNKSRVVIFPVTNKEGDNLGIIALKQYGSSYGRYEQSDIVYRFNKKTTQRTFDNEYENAGKMFTAWDKKKAPMGKTHDEAPAKVHIVIDNPQQVTDVGKAEAGVYSYLNGKTLGERLGIETDTTKNKGSHVDNGKADLFKQEEDTELEATRTKMKIDESQVIQPKEVVSSLKHHFKDNNKILVAETVDGIDLDEMKEFYDEISGGEDGESEKKKKYAKWLDEKFKTLGKGAFSDRVTGKARKFEKTTDKRTIICPVRDKDNNNLGIIAFRQTNRSTNKDEVLFRFNTKTDKPDFVAPMFKAWRDENKLCDKSGHEDIDPYEVSPTKITSQQVSSKVDYDAGAYSVRDGKTIGNEAIERYLESVKADEIPLFQKKEGDEKEEEVKTLRGEIEANKDYDGLIPIEKDMNSGIIVTKCSPEKLGKHGEVEREEEVSIGVHFKDTKKRDKAMAWLEKYPEDVTYEKDSVNGNRLHIKFKSLNTLKKFNSFRKDIKSTISQGEKDTLKSAEHLLNGLTESFSADTLKFLQEKRTGKVKDLKKHRKSIQSLKEYQSVVEGFKGILRTQYERDKEQSQSSVIEKETESSFEKALQPVQRKFDQMKRRLDNDIQRSEMEVDKYKSKIKRGKRTLKEIEKEVKNLKKEKKDLDKSVKKLKGEQGKPEVLAEAQRKLAVKTKQLEWAEKDLKDSTDYRDECLETTKTVAAALMINYEGEEKEQLKTYERELKKYKKDHPDNAGVAELFASERGRKILKKHKDSSAKGIDGLNENFASIGEKEKSIKDNLLSLEREFNGLAKRKKDLDEARKCLVIREGNLTEKKTQRKTLVGQWRELRDECKRGCLRIVNPWVEACVKEYESSSIINKSMDDYLRENLEEKKGTVGKDEVKCVEFRNEKGEKSAALFIGRGIKAHNLKAVKSLKNFVKRGSGSQPGKRNYHYSMGRNSRIKSEHVQYLFLFAFIDSKCDKESFSRMKYNGKPVKPVLESLVEGSNLSDEELAEKLKEYILNPNEKGAKAKALKEVKSFYDERMVKAEEKKKEKEEKFFKENSVAPKDEKLKELKKIDYESSDASETFFKKTSEDVETRKQQIKDRLGEAVEDDVLDELTVQEIEKKEEEYSSFVPLSNEKFKEFEKNLEGKKQEFEDKMYTAYFKETKDDSVVTKEKQALEARKAKVTRLKGKYDAERLKFQGPFVKMSNANLDSDKNNVKERWEDGVDKIDAAADDFVENEDKLATKMSEDQKTVWGKFIADLKGDKGREEFIRFHEKKRGYAKKSDYMENGLEVKNDDGGDDTKEYRTNMKEDRIEFLKKKINDFKKKIQDDFDNSTTQETFLGDTEGKEQKWVESHGSRKSYYERKTHTSSLLGIYNRDCESDSYALKVEKKAAILEILYARGEHTAARNAIKSTDRKMLGDIADTIVAAYCEEDAPDNGKRWFGEKISKPATLKKLLTIFPKEQFSELYKYRWGYGYDGNYVLNKELVKKHYEVLDGMPHGSDQEKTARRVQQKKFLAAVAGEKEALDELIPKNGEAKQGERWSLLASVAPGAAFKFLLKNKGEEALLKKIFEYHAKDPKDIPKWVIEPGPRANFLGKCFSLAKAQDDDGDAWKGMLKALRQATNDDDAKLERFVGAMNKEVKDAIRSYKDGGAFDSDGDIEALGKHMDKIMTKIENKETREKYGKDLDDQTGNDNSRDLQNN